MLCGWPRRCCVARDPDPDSGSVEVAPPFRTVASVYGLIHPPRFRCGLCLPFERHPRPTIFPSLDGAVPQEREAKKCAEQEAEARSADARGLERRLKAAVEAAALAEHSAAKCIEVSADPPDTVLKLSLRQHLSSASAVLGCQVECRGNPSSGY